MSDLNQLDRAYARLDQEYEEFKLIRSDLLTLQKRLQAALNVVDGMLEQTEGLQDHMADTRTLYKSLVNILVSDPGVLIDLLIKAPAPTLESAFTMANDDLFTKLTLAWERGRAAFFGRGKKKKDG